MTDGMFWPRDKNIAADALAMLHVVAIDAPDMVGDDARWISGYLDPASQKPLPAAWVRRAKQAEAAYRKCHAPPEPAP